MTIIDLLIVVILAMGALAGFRQGFIVQTAAILGAVVSLVVAHAEYTDARGLLEQVAPHSPWTTVIAYLLVFLVIWSAIVLVARRLRSFIRLLRLGLMDRIGGAILGFLQGILLVELLLYLGMRVPSGAIRHAVKHAALTPTFIGVIPYLHQLFPHIGH